MAPVGSRSEHLRVAVGFNPRWECPIEWRRVATRDARGGTRACGRFQASLRDAGEPMGNVSGWWCLPWVETHGYPHRLATRGAGGGEQGDGWGFAKPAPCL